MIEDSYDNARPLPITRMSACPVCGFKIKRDQRAYIETCCVDGSSQEYIRLVHVECAEEDEEGDFDD